MDSARWTKVNLLRETDKWLAELAAAHELSKTAMVRLLVRREHQWMQLDKAIDYRPIDFDGAGWIRGKS